MVTLRVNCVLKIQTWMIGPKIGTSTHRSWSGWRKRICVVRPLSRANVFMMGRLLFIRTLFSYARRDACSGARRNVWRKFFIARDILSGVMMTMIIDHLRRCMQSAKRAFSGTPRSFSTSARARGATRGVAMRATCRIHGHAFMIAGVRAKFAEDLVATGRFTRATRQRFDHARH